MVDKDLRDDCFRAYGYFRWADDMVDQVCQTRGDRISFIKRQGKLVEMFYQKKRPDDLTHEEEILADLIKNDVGSSGLLKSYIRNFIAIIQFDADRKGMPISGGELDWYAKTLGKAVTDGIQYFICNGHPYPESESRYLAATAAHIAHMLRDTAVDITEGYLNFPEEDRQLNVIDPTDFSCLSKRNWVKARVELAREYFNAGKRYLDSLDAFRCKIVGYWYCARFERILDTIEKDNFVLRSAYRKPPMLFACIKFALRSVSIAFQHYAQGFPKFNGRNSLKEGAAQFLPPISSD
jgi:phytoene/squalene synthetase